MSRLAVFLLGSFQVTLDGLPLTAFATDKVRALLAFLAVESGVPQRREALAAMLWPNRPEAAARTSLRQALYRLRRALGDRQASVPHLLITAKEVQLNPDNSHWLDVTEFEAHISTCHARHPHGLSLCPDCLARLVAAVQLYQGEFLAGFTLPACPRFEWWQLNTQEACHRHALEALYRLVVTYEAQRDYVSVSRYARREIELEPWRESAHRHCMRALALSGQRGEALHQYELCRALLAQEMGVEPSLETTQLYERIRSGDLPGITAYPETRRAEGTAPVGLPLALPRATRVPSPSAAGLGDEPAA
jgi:DNA-binding SARP family transcriptional activator